MDESNKELDSLLVRSVREYAIFRMDSQGVITSWNEGVMDVLGYSESEWIGKDATAIFTPEDRERGAPAHEMSQSAKTGQAMDDRWHIRKDGSRRWINGIMMGLRDEQGNLLGFAKIMRDNTKLKQAQESLQESNEELEERVRERTAELEALNRELQDFNYSVSHDLRAPLRGIDGFSQVLEEEYDDVLDETGKGYLERVRAGAMRMGKLLDDLLALSRLTKGPTERQRVDLSGQARVVTDALRSGHGRRVAEVRVQEGVTAEGDPESLRIVLERLFDNAWKFTQDREGVLIEFGVSFFDGADAYFVRDNGEGFDMKYADKLFVPFQSLHSPGRFSGTGVGLAIVQRIIHRHGGRVWAESEVGKGATFYFTLPVREQDSSGIGMKLGGGV
ncbi:MAG: ATP-binding protein [Trueperaceae bacterium]